MGPDTRREPALASCPPACCFRVKGVASPDSSIAPPTDELEAPALTTCADTLGDPFRITGGPHQGTYTSAEATFTESILTLPGSVMKGGTTYVGSACPGEQVLPAVDDGDPTTQTIAVLLGKFGCFFQDEAQAALNAGCDGCVVINPFGETVFPMAGFSYHDIPGEMVGHGTGLAIFNASSDSDLVVGQSGATISVGRLRVQAVLAQETP